MRWNPLTRATRAIIRREYLQRVRSKWFLLSTFGLPLVMGGLVVFSGWLFTRTGEPAAAWRAGVVDRSGALEWLAVEELLADSIFAAPVEGAAGLPEDSLAARLLGSVFDVYLVLPADALAPASGGAAEVRLLTRGSVSTQAGRSLRAALDRALVRARLAEAGVEGVDTEGLLREASLDVVSVSPEGARSQEVFQAVSFVLALVFYMVLLVYGQMIVRSILEEKTSDIVEVMVSSVRPWELMLGKIVGVGAVGLTQIAIWGLAAAGAVAYGLTAGAAALAEAGIDPSTVRVPAGLVAGILVFLVLGYLLYAGLFAGTGATLSNEQDAQQAALPVVFLIVIPFIAAQGVIEHPNAVWSVALSLVPFFSPLLMPSRLLVTAVPLWEVGAALALLVACILVVAWLAGRIYRVGILMKGKRPNLPELVRWLRYG